MTTTLSTKIEKYIVSDVESCTLCDKQISRGRTAWGTDVGTGCTKAHAKILIDHALEVEKQQEQDARDAQIDAQERDTLQSTASAKAERDAQISKLLDDELALRTIVREREKLTATHKHNAFRNGRVHRSALKAYYASKDLLDLEIAKLNSVRGQLCVLSPVGSYAIRRADESIAFVTIR